MALFDQLLLIVNALTVLFSFVTLIYIKRNREFERIELEGSLNALLFGMFFLFISALANMFVYLEKNFHATFSYYLPDVSTYAGYLQAISDLAFIPLFAVCFLVAVLLISQRMPRQKKEMPEPPAVI